MQLVRKNKKKYNHLQIIRFGYAIHPLTFYEHKTLLVRGMPIAERGVPWSSNHVVEDKYVEFEVDPR